jgi:hypothetical protein
MPRVGKTEDGGQRTEDRGQKAEGRGGKREIKDWTSFRRKREVIDSIMTIHYPQPP